MNRPNEITLRALSCSAAIAILSASAAPSGCNDEAPAGAQAEAQAPASAAAAPAEAAGKAPPTASSFWQLLEPPPAGAKAGDIYRTQERSDAPPGASGWNVIYVAEITEGVLKYVSGEIYLPKAAASEPRDVVLWNHETTGVADVCAPSRRDFIEDNHERVPGITELLKRGYVVAMSDYPGQGVPGPAFYMVGRVNARASLDMLKAVQNFPNARASKRFVMYGWSQGGQTTMWAESIAASYAAGFTGMGAALIAPAVRIRALTLNSMQDTMLAGYVISTLPGIKAAYPSLRYSDFLTNEGLEQFPAMADGCFDVWRTASSVADPYQPNALTPDSPWWNAMTDVDNFTPAGSMPFVVYQGTADTTTPVSLTANEVDALCQSGVDVEYLALEGLDHVGVVPVAASMFPGWAADRFAGRPATNTCAPR